MMTLRLTRHPLGRAVCRRVLLAAVAAALAACSTTPPSNVKSNAQITPTSRVTEDLAHLPRPKKRLAVAVYGFRDQTGQYKPSPDSSYSTSVTQGAAAMLVKALKDSGWFVPVEREGLQNLLTERKIVRAIESPTDKGKPLVNLPNLLPASLIIEGGVIAYESNVRTGGKGANYLGVGSSTQYRVDQVTVSLRGVDIRTGQVLDTVSVTKTIYSYQFSASLYKFVAYQQLLQAETGYTSNEPAQLAVREAIEAAVIHLTVLGVRDRYLELNDAQDFYTPLVQRYLKEDLRALGIAVSEDEPILLRAPFGGAPAPTGSASGNIGAEATPEPAAARPPVVVASAPPPAAQPRAAATAPPPAAQSPAAPSPTAQPRAVATAPPPSRNGAPAVQGAPRMSALHTTPPAAAATAPPPAKSTPAPQTASAAAPAKAPAAPKPAPAKPLPSDDIFKQYWKTQGEAVAQ